MYDLTNDTTEHRKRVKTYKNRQTGTLVKISPIYQDSNKIWWWGFNDLFQVPYIRQAYAKHITDTFTMGLSLQDILEWCSEEKALLTSTDPEKYEKLYALILKKESLANYTADPIKMHLSLCTLYILEEDEQIDYFDNEIAAKKMKLWLADKRATAFFLNWHNEATKSFMKRLGKILPIVSQAGP